MVGWPEHEDYEGWLARLALPHRASRAFWHLVLSPQALPVVRQGLKDANPDIRRHCARILDHLADEASFESLLEALDDPDPQVRTALLHAIACDRCKADVCAPAKEQVLPAAIRLLREDPDAHVRAMAAVLVGKWVHEDQRALQALTAAQNFDPKPAVRKTSGWYAPSGPIHTKTARAVSG